MTSGATQIRKPALKPAHQRRRRNDPLGSKHSQAMSFWTRTMMSISDMTLSMATTWRTSMHACRARMWAVDNEHTGTCGRRCRWQMSGNPTPWQAALKCRISALCGSPLQTLETPPTRSFCRPRPPVSQVQVCKSSSS